MTKTLVRRYLENRRSREKKKSEAPLFFAVAGQHTEYEGCAFYNSEGLVAGNISDQLILTNQPYNVTFTFEVTPENPDAVENILKACYGVRNPDD